jgi:hypothetical protein
LSNQNEFDGVSSPDMNILIIKKVVSLMKRNPLENAFLLCKQLDHYLQEILLFDPLSDPFTNQLPGYYVPEMESKVLVVTL